ncbi:hypothetical protein HYT25_02335 [Candidatus Pacearchaeota archaeon]|nr:hypothetical protein [Candidatus Pacearchaeota archaeon]
MKTKRVSQSDYAYASRSTEKRVHSFSSKTRKRGATQIGFVLSFVIFIMFIIFMFSAIEPFLKTQASKQSLLDFFRFSLVEEFRVGDLTVMTIDGEPISPDKDCVSLQNIIGSGDNQIAESYITNNQLKIKNNSKNFDYSRSGNSLQVGFWAPGDLQTNGFFFKIYYSEALEQNQVSMSGCHPVSDYTVGSLVEEQTQILESNIYALKDEYELDCGETIKTRLGVPEGNEFTFRFESADGTLVIEPNIEACGGIPNTNVYATTFPLQYLDSDANLQIGFLTIKVW